MVTQHGGHTIVGVAVGRVLSTTVAEAEAGAVKLDENEYSDARW